MKSTIATQLIQRAPLMLIMAVLVSGCAVNASDDGDEEEIGVVESAVSASTLENIGSSFDQRNAFGDWVTCSDKDALDGSGNKITTNCAGTGGVGTLVDTAFVFPYTSPDGTTNTGHMTISANNYNSDGSIANTSDGNAYWYTKWASPGYRLTHWTLEMDVWVGNSVSNYRAIEWDGNQYYGGKQYVFGWQANVASGKWRYYDASQPTGYGWIDSSKSTSSFTSTNWHHVQMKWTINSSTSMTVTCMNLDSTGWCPNYAIGTRDKTATNAIGVGLQGDKRTGIGMSWYYKNIKLTYD